MASNADLQITIGADSSDLQKEIAKAKSQLAKFESTTAKSSNSIKKFGKATSANATPSVLEFNRAIQDAPFGIQGVGNNIQQLTANFGQLKKQTGSTKSALLALGKGLVSGPLAIVTAVSVVTTLLTVFADKLKFTKKEVKSLDETLQDYVKTLKDVDKAQLKGGQSAAKEITNLRLLKGQVENTNFSLEDRNKAYKELQRLYPSYFGSLDREGALAGTLKTAYDDLTTSILKKAKSQAAADLIAENFKKQLALEQQLLDVQKEQIDLSLEAAKANQDTTKGLVIQTGLNTKNTAVVSDALVANLAITDNLDEQKGIQENINKLKEQDLKLTKLIAEQGGVVIKPPKPTNVEPTITTPVINRDAILSQTAVQIADIQESLNDRFGEIFNDFNSSLVIAPNANAISQATEQWNEYRNFIANEALKFTLAVNELVGGGIADAAENVGRAIGEAVATGGNVFEAVGLALLDSIGNFLTQFGKLMIKYGIAIKAYSIASKALLNPLTAGPAAVGLIAAGAALTLIGSAISGFVQGQTSGASAGGSSEVGSGSRQSFSGSGSNFGGGFSSGSRVVFEIAGTKLVGVISNTLRRDAALGGSLSVTN